MKNKQFLGAASTFGGAAVAPGAGWFHKLVRVSLLLGAGWVSALAGEVRDLSGEWRFALDPGDLGLAAGPEGWRFPDRVRLPGTVAAQGFGEEPSIRTQWTGDGWRYPELFREWQADNNFKFPFFLQPPKVYVGPAWYQREIEVPEDWAGHDTAVLLERVHWWSTVWVDGREVGRCGSLGTPHEFNLGRLAPGKHQLTLRIDNRLSPVNVGPLSHSVTDHTQGNWNGVVGRMEMRKLDAGRVEAVAVHPSIDGRVRAVVRGVLADARGGERVRLAVKRRGQDDAVADGVSGELTVDGDGRFEAEVVARVAAPALWSEFSPDLYEAVAVVERGGTAVTGGKAVSFGIREVGTLDGRITVNGRKIFLRGTLECCIFPLTGHPPTDVASWKRIVKICQAHGLNHIRFHSWCPPEAAFVAADELGFYYQVEVSSWANQGAEIGSGRPLDAWLEEETRRMLEGYGNHPSFLLMAYGNEPAGPRHKEWLRDWVARHKAEDPRRLYTTGAGWPVESGSDFHSSPDPRIQAWGQELKSVINGEPPRTDFDWSGFARKHADAPVVSHEIGQWCVYPDFRAIEKHTGYFKARNFEIFRETARRNGLLDQAEEMLYASGRLQVLCYKHDIEAALRTPGFGGYQLLDLHDFPGQGTALVGVLDAFWDGKGYVTPEEYRSFSGPVVPLARMPKMVLTAAEPLEAELELAQFGADDLKAVQPTWELTGSDGKVVAHGVLPARDLASGGLHRLGRIVVSLADVAAPAKLRLTVGAKGHGFRNGWDVFVYPAQGSPPPSGVLVTRELHEAREALADGRKVLWMPPATQVRNDPKRPLKAGFSSIFWNTAWTEWQAPHTLGILCDPAHPAFARFPTDLHSNWQWWEIQQGTQPFILTEMGDVRLLVQVIDDWVTNRKLGYLFEAKVGPGLLMACSADLLSDPAGRPAARQLLASILAYMDSPAFAPNAGLPEGGLNRLLAPK